MHRIRKWIEKDISATEYAKRHELNYTRQCQYFVKLDIRKCYPTANVDAFLKLFRKDCANEDLIWLWESLLKSHHVAGYTGFMIGALPSQWACQYMISFIYRYAKEQCKIRREKKIQSVKHMLVFMDDMLLIGSNRAALKTAVRDVILYTKDMFGWTIKPNWHICNIDNYPIDMMGFVIHGDAHVTIRARNFIHARRIAMRCEEQGRIGLCRAKRIVSYKGYFKYSNSKLVQNKYNLHELFSDSSKIISRHDKDVNRRDLCPKS